MIIGERVQLIPLNEECFNLTLTWVNNPELRLFTGTRFPVSKYEHENWFKGRATDKYNKTYAIQLRGSNKIIGLVGNNEYDPINRTTYPFIYIGETDMKEKGIGQESFSLFLDFCFNELNIHKVYGYLYAYNKASRNMLEKCGYLLEGELKQHWFKDGEYHDVLVMGRIREK
jgi:diamine N-acetyltransferase